MNTVKCSLCFMMSNPLSFSHVVWARMTGVASGGRPSICFHILGWHFFLRDLPPASGRGMPKKLVQLLRLNTLNIGTLIGLFIPQTIQHSQEPPHQHRWQRALKKEKSSSTTAIRLRTECS